LKSRLHNNPLQTCAIEITPTKQPLTNSAIEIMPTQQSLTNSAIEIMPTQQFLTNSAIEITPTQQSVGGNLFALFLRELIRAIDLTVIQLTQRININLMFFNTAI